MMSPLRGHYDRSALVLHVRRQALIISAIAEP